MDKDNKNKALVSAISPPRFQPFLSKTGGDYSMAFELYEKNVQMSAGFYPILSFFEVCLRNKINEAMIKRYGDGWLLDPTTPLHDKDREDIQKVCDRLRERGRLVGDTSEDMGRIIAGLSLGFWMKIFTRRYSHSLWSATLRHAFPNYRGDLKSLKYRMSRIWELRNRIAHYEPIIFIDDIETMREEILEVIGWMCKDTEEWVRGLNR